MTSETTPEIPVTTRLARAAVFAVTCGVLIMSQPAERGSAQEGTISVPLPAPSTEIPVPPPSRPPGDVEAAFERSIQDSTVPPLPVFTPTGTPATVNVQTEATPTDATLADAPVPADAPNLDPTPAVDRNAADPNAVAAPANAPVAQPATSNDDWVVQIIPGPSRRKDLIINGLSYQEVYDSIPYRQSEYLANPSYRHDTTMEVLFGQMRATTIVRNTSPERIDNTPPPITQPYLSTPSDFYSYPQQFGLFPGSVPFVNPFLPGLAPRLAF